MILPHTEAGLRALTAVRKEEFQGIFQMLRGSTTRRIFVPGNYFDFVNPDLLYSGDNPLDPTADLGLGEQVVLIEDDADAIALFDMRHLSKVVPASPLPYGFIFVKQFPEALGAFVESSVLGLSPRSRNFSASTVVASGALKVVSETQDGKGAVSLLLSGPACWVPSLGTWREVSLDDAHYFQINKSVLATIEELDWCRRHPRRLIEMKSTGGLSCEMLLRQ